MTGLGSGVVAELVEVADGAQVRGWQLVDVDADVELFLQGHLNAHVVQADQVNIADQGLRSDAVDVKVR
ncbi:hypothetical protein D3C85_1866970 [compost metagenome]